MDLARELKKLHNLMETLRAIFVVSFGKESGETGDQRKNPDHNTVEICWNTYKNSRDMRRLTFTQISEKKATN